MNTLLVPVAGGTALPLLVSPRFPVGFGHGFTTRAGGVSRPPFDTLNLGWKWGDEPGLVEENRGRLLQAAGVLQMFRASQVHGTRILRVRAGDKADAIANLEADGLCTDDPYLGLSVHVADCTPMVVACSRTGACAALHAGWRGTVAGMARQAVLTLGEEFACQPRDLHVALGPCIGRCCFEVGPEVAELFAAALPAAHACGVILQVPGGKAHVDLRLFQRMQFEAAGVPSEQIDSSPSCTVCDAEGRFYSFRRDGRKTGQAVGFVVRVPERGVIG